MCPQLAGGRLTGTLSYMRYVFAAAALIILAVAALVFGKRHARRVQRRGRIHIDRFKLKRRHAEIELEVFGSRELVAAIHQYSKDHHVSIEAARQQARIYLRAIVPNFNLLAYYRT